MRYVLSLQNVSHSDQRAYPDANDDVVRMAHVLSCILPNDDTPRLTPYYHSLIDVNAIPPRLSLASLASLEPVSEVIQGCDAALWSWCRPADISLPFSYLPTMTFYPPPLQHLTDHPSLSLTPLSSNIDVVCMFRGPPSSRPLVVKPNIHYRPIYPPS